MAEAVLCCAWLMLCKDIFYDKVTLIKHKLNCDGTFHNGGKKISELNM